MKVEYIKTNSWSDTINLAKEKKIDLIDSISYSNSRSEYLDFSNKYINAEIVIIANNKEKLQNFFDNYFNESIHKEYKSFFESLIDFIYVVYQDKTIKNKLELIYATLRFVKFVQGDKK